MVNPLSVDDIRRHVYKLYRERLTELSKEKDCDRCKYLDLDRIEIVVLPGRGRYFGWGFRSFHRQRL